MVSPYHKYRALYSMQLIQGHVGLFQIKFQYLQLVLRCRRLRLQTQRCHLFFNTMEHIGDKSCSVRPEVGADRNQLLYLRRMPDSQQQTGNTAITPANDIAAIQVQTLDFIPAKCSK